MLNDIAKNIILKALKIRKERGEYPEEILSTYNNLSEDEKLEILKKLNFR